MASITFILIVGLTISLSIYPCKENDVSNSGSQNSAMNFVKALQEENFLVIWNYYLPYRKHVAEIQNSSPKQYWQSLEQQEYEKERLKQYPDGRLTIRLFM